nr:E3 ubiquitin-protein ligase RNFT1-like [Tanacetum cinerariifolium]
MYKSNDILRKQIALKGERKFSVLAGYYIVFVLQVIGVYWWVLISKTTFVGVESMVLIPETSFVDVESRVLIPETTFVVVESWV